MRKWGTETNPSHVIICFRTLNLVNYCKVTRLTFLVNYTNMQFTRATTFSFITFRIPFTYQNQNTQNSSALWCQSLKCALNAAPFSLSVRLRRAGQKLWVILHLGLTESWLILLHVSHCSYSYSVWVCQLILHYTKTWFVTHTFKNESVSQWCHRRTSKRTVFYLM